MDIVILVAIIFVLIIYITRDKTTVSDKTVITQNKTIKTNDGNIQINRTRTINSTSTQYHNIEGNQDKMTLISDNHDRYLQEMRQRQALSKERFIPVKAPYSMSSSQGYISPRPALRSAQPQAVHRHSVNIIEHEPMMTENTKICPRCGRTLQLSKFRRSSKHPDGYTTWCAECLSAPRNTKQMKYCPKCKRRRRKTSFYKNSKRKDGLTLWCKDCMDHS
ncbi:hypothetical protein ACOGYQ_001367 [Edwardsiella piscicida]|uniref:hypothetical protein n=1 Tax=Edwardsiella piscicida TaxID=1263550 RepID=UPI0009015A72|nr:hypothetical protein [Edwardsiella piscicida]EKS7767252.1 hypothetical protein [Edwardsiella piscicida]UBU80020.1 hypothetical protein A9797_17965 [Edwardsiella piscicida]UCQ32699.1 hypothetical protein DCF74_07925 [Edwardsiella piscicida]UCQ59016.1 hypothetical protein DCF40_07915 [Edwardsiella piscicida]WAM46175.1 hypothetical protein NMC32_08000 [Edwardsiella piscicida]